MDPDQSGNQILVSRICGIFIFFSEWRQIEIAENIQPMIDRYCHNIPVLTQMVALISDMLDCGPGRKSAAVQPHHNRLLCLWIQALRPNVQILAVFILRPVAMTDKQFIAWRIQMQQRTHISECQRVADSFPRRCRLRTLKPLRLRVWNPVKGKRGIQPVTADFSLPGLYNRLILFAYKIFCHI